MSRYPWRLLPQLANSVANGNVDQAHIDLENFLIQVETDELDTLNKKKLRAITFLSPVMRAAIDGGAVSEVIWNTQFEFVQQVDAASDWDEMVSYFHDYLDSVAILVKRGQTVAIGRVIEAIRSDLAERPALAKSLGRYAQEAGISLSHLSREFSRLTGRSFTEERRRTRTDVATRLLRETNMKVCAIGENIGVDSPSRFIQEFRHETGVTPGQYRRLHRQQP